MENIEKIENIGNIGNPTVQDKSKKLKSSYQITIARILRSKSLLKELSDEKNSCDFKESKSFKSFFDRLDSILDKRKINNEYKEKIIWTIFVYFNQLKRL